MPSFQRAFLEKKRKALEEKLQKQKAQIEQEIRDIEQRRARKQQKPAQSTLNVSHSSSSLKLNPKRALSVPLGGVQK